MWFERVYKQARLRDSRFRKQVNSKWVYVVTMLGLIAITIVLVYKIFSLRVVESSH
jgi:hypothetical protein